MIKETTSIEKNENSNLNNIDTVLDKSNTLRAIPEVAALCKFVSENDLAHEAKTILGKIALTHKPKRSSSKKKTRKKRKIQ